MLEWDMSQCRMLALGCSEAFVHVPSQAGLAHMAWGALGMEVMFMGQSHAAQATAKLLLGHPHHNPALHRYDVLVPPGYVAMDDASKLSTMRGLGRAEARERSPEVERVFLAPGPVLKFDPEYRLGISSAAVPVGG